MARKKLKGKWQRPLRRLAIPLGHMGLSPRPKVPAAIADSGLGVTTISSDTEELILMTLTTCEQARPSVYFVKALYQIRVGKESREA